VEFFSSPAPDPSGFGEGSRYLGFATANVADAPLTLSATVDGAPVGSYVTATATLMLNTFSGLMTSEFSAPVQVMDLGRAAAVVGRSVFYKPTGTFMADNVPAIAPDKQALLPGQTGSFANVTSYTLGLNGLVVDIAGLVQPGAVTAGDFEFRSGARGDPSTWDVRTPSGFFFRPGEGAGGADRFILTFPDNSIRDRWLQATVKPSAHSVLARPDVFYFGNLVGETGDAASPLRVTALDLAGTRRARGNARVGLTNPYDITRNGLVTATDLAAVRQAMSHSLAPLSAPPATSSAGAIPASPLRRAWLWEEWENPAPVAGA
jgi:hypothetical protein